MQLKIKFIFFFIISFNLTGIIHAQTFGFGCLGFAGGYGGFVYQSYNAEGLNQFVRNFNSEIFQTAFVLKEFDSAYGYRIGINFFRATFPEGFFITAKGYYQSLGKTNSVTQNTSNGEINYDYKLDLKNWAVGFDLGLNVMDRVSWKVIDGALHFNNIRLTSTENSPGVTEVTMFESDAGVLGYSLGTGVIIALIKDYISLEGLAGYTFLKVEDLMTEDGEKFSSYLQDPGVTSTKNFIDSGGFNAVIQLNFGFPL